MALEWKDPIKERPRRFPVERCLVYDIMGGYMLAYHMNNQFGAVNPAERLIKVVAWCSLPDPP